MIGVAFDSVFFQKSEEFLFKPALVTVFLLGMNVRNCRRLQRDTHRDMVAGRDSNMWTWLSVPPTAIALKLFLRAMPPRYAHRSACLAGGIKPRRPSVEKTQ
jgi:hypothetical protein